MRSAIVVLVLVLGGCMMDTREPVAEPVCDVGTDGDAFGFYTCDGERASNGPADWHVYCVDGAISMHADPVTYELTIDCDGDCGPVVGPPGPDQYSPMGPCRTDMPLVECERAQVPTCVRASNACDIAPDRC